MKKPRSGKLVKQTLFTGGRAVCLLFCLTLCQGEVVAAQTEQPPAEQVAATAPAPPEAPAPGEVETQEAGQSPEELAAIEAEKAQVAEALQKLLESMNMGSFEYQVEDRPDPFMPFISEKIVQATDSETGEKLTGMRQLEPGQLTLTAILFTEANPIAMVEDSSHKGYVIKRGSRIGKFGIVSDILPNSVIIKQLSYSMNQEKKYSTVEMILRKEGEK